MNYDRIRMTRTNKFHLGNDEFRKCDTNTFSKNHDRGWEVSVESLKYFFEQGEDYIVKNSCQRCFPNSSAYETIKRLIEEAA